MQNGSKSRNYVGINYSKWIEYKLCKISINQAKLHSLQLHWTEYYAKLKLKLHKTLLNWEKYRKNELCKVNAI